MTSSQMRARIYALAIIALTFAASVTAANTPMPTTPPGVDVSAMMNSIDMSTLPVHNITDAF